MTTGIAIWYLAKIIIRATKNYSKEIIKSRFNLNDKQIDLLYEAGDNPNKLGDFIASLKYKQDVVKQYELAKEEIKAEEVKIENTKREHDDLIPQKKLKKYIELLDDIFYIAALRNESVILNGFLNGKEYISCFEISNKSNFSIELTISENAIKINHPYSIKIEKVENDGDRQAKFKDYQKQIKYSKEKKLNDKNYLFKKVKVIYDSFIEVEKVIDFGYKDEQIDPENYINEDYSGFKQMRSSLNEYIENLMADYEFINSL